MRNKLGYVKYILAEFTPYTQEFAKIDAVANICTQIATTHDFEYGKEFVAPNAEVLRLNPDVSSVCEVAESNR